ncbi:hypothetical protein TNCV_2570001 [Trichonephila clavipes]|nr:hypothetical protein TNCV_2570001 [Trichonephila clavipes]
MKLYFVHMGLNGFSSFQGEGLVWNMMNMLGAQRSAITDRNIAKIRDMSWFPLTPVVRLLINTTTLKTRIEQFGWLLHQANASAHMAQSVKHFLLRNDRDGRTYRNCDNCLDSEQTPAHVFDSPAVLAALQEIGVLFSSTNLYVGNIEQIA